MVTNLTVYFIILVVINLVSILNINKINHNLLFDSISLNILSFSYIIFYVIYKNINYTILLNFLLIFICETYKRDVTNKKYRFLISILQIINLSNILLLLRYLI